MPGPRPKNGKNSPPPQAVGRDTRAPLAASGHDHSEVLRSVLDSMTEGAIAVEETGRLLFYNAAAERILGAVGLHPRDWICGCPCAHLPDAVTPYPPQQSPLARALRGEVVEDAEVVLRAPEAREGLWLVVNGRPLQFLHGSRRGAVLLFRDVTRRRRIEEALLRSERHYRSMIENVSDIISVMDTEGRIHYQSPSVQRVLGYSPNELTGQIAFVLVHPDDTERIRVLHRAALNHPGSTFSAECRLRHRDGSWRYFDCLGRALADDEGILGTIVTSRDVTERKRAGERLFFQASLLDQVPNSVIAISNDGTILYWNRHAEFLHQWKSAEVFGKRIVDPEISLVTSEIWAEIQAALQTSGHWEGETIRRRRDGSTFPVHLSVSLIRSENGDVIGGLCVCDDITERKHVEDRLRASSEQMRRLAGRLENAREAERTLIAREIHDQLGQDLTALKLELARLAKRLFFEEEVVADIRSASTLVDNTISSVQRIATELRPAVLDDLGLGTALEWQAQEFEARTGIRCAVTRRPVDIDPSRAVSTAIFRIFQEILTNVARHSSATQVAVSLAVHGGQLVLNVKDNGRGITPEQLAAPGSLGLLGMRERALDLRGELEIRGAPGEGTTVTVRVPWQGTLRRVRGLSSRRPRKSKPC